MKESPYKMYFVTALQLYTFFVYAKVDSTHRKMDSLKKNLLIQNEGSNSVNILLERCDKFWARMMIPLLHKKICL
jgi:hypothetical protein